MKDAAFPYIYTSLDMATCAPTMNARIHDAPPPWRFRIREAVGCWEITLHRYGVAEFTATTRSWSDARDVVARALDHGLFLGYPVGSRP